MENCTISARAGSLNCGQSKLCGSPVYPQNPTPTMEKRCMQWPSTCEARWRAPIAQQAWSPAKKNEKTPEAHIYSARGKFEYRANWPAFFRVIHFEKWTAKYCGMSAKCDILGFDVIGSWIFWMSGAPRSVKCIEISSGGVWHRALATWKAASTLGT